MPIELFNEIVDSRRWRTRKSGRPSNNARYLRKSYLKKFMLTKFGFYFNDMLEEKGYIMNKTQKIRAEKAQAKADAIAVEAGGLPAAEPELGNKVAKDEFMGKEADVALKGVVAALLKGKEVPGFTLLPEEKAKTNQTVKSIIVTRFSPGHPAYGMSLVELDEKYV